MKSIRQRVLRVLKRHQRRPAEPPLPTDNAEAARFLKSLGFTPTDLAGVILDIDQLRAITTEIHGRPGGSLLVFGCGNDSPFWERVNRGGTTVFLEDDPQWAETADAKLKSSTIHLVDYSTKRSEWRALRDAPAKLDMALPPEILSRRWDVILVDAPSGYTDEQPGRMKSIYAASRLIAPRGCIFLHDCERIVEHEYASRYFGQERLFLEVPGSGGLLRGYAF